MSNQNSAAVAANPLTVADLTSDLRAVEGLIEDAVGPVRQNAFDLTVAADDENDDRLVEARQRRHEAAGMIDAKTLVAEKRDELEALDEVDLPTDALFDLLDEVADELRAEADDRGDDAYDYNDGARQTDDDDDDRWSYLRAKASDAYSEMRGIRRARDLLTEHRDRRAEVEA